MWTYKWLISENSFAGIWLKKEAIGKTADRLPLANILPNTWFFLIETKKFCKVSKMAFEQWRSLHGNQWQWHTLIFFPWYAFCSFLLLDHFYSFFNSQLKVSSSRHNSSLLSLSQRLTWVSFLYLSMSSCNSEEGWKTCIPNGEGWDTGAEMGRERSHEKGQSCTEERLWSLIHVCSLEQSAGQQAWWRKLFFFF